MNLIIGNKYRYENMVRVGISCKKHKKVLEVTYVGKEGNNEVFNTDHGTELLIHTSDVNNMISEI